MRKTDIDENVLCLYLRLSLILEQTVILESFFLLHKVYLEIKYI